MNKIWYQRHILSYLLLPFTGIYYIIISIRKCLYKYGIKKITKPKVPIIIVGNITVGGTGKTPFVIWLAEYLQQQGMRPGIVSRGYGGGNITYPHLVSIDDSAMHVGDEPLLLARRTKCPVVIDPNRVNAAQHLLQQTNCNIIISDDGLQHYALGRDLEIVITDSQRRLGNGFLLPAGPLRESKKRLKTVDMIIANGAEMQLIAAKSCNLAQPNLTQNLLEFSGKKVHAVAAIGNPDRFFEMLQTHGLKITAHPFPDHHMFTTSDLDFADNMPVIMTEKDAVKCQNIAKENWWYVPVDATISEPTIQKLKKLINKVLT